jgi:hypothetical protein
MAHGAYTGDVPISMNVSLNPSPRINAMDQLREITAFYGTECPGDWR